MPPERATDRLLEFLEDELGGRLRAVVQYTPEAADFVYLRGDLQGRVNIVDFDLTIEQARQLHGQLDTVGRLQGRTLGHPVGNVAIFEHALVVVLRYTDDEGVVTSFDRTDGRDLAAFVEQCSEVLIRDD